MSDALRDYLVRILENAGAQLAEIVIGLVVVGIPIALAAYVLFRRVAARHGVGISFEWRDDDASPAAPLARPVHKAASPPPRDDLDPHRMLATVYKVLMLMVALTLLGGAVLAYWVATPGNGLLLVALILIPLSLMAFRSVGKYDRQERDAEEWRGLWDDFLSKVEVTTSHDGPDVHSMDNRAIAMARRMAADGASLDDICRAVEPGYATWNEPHREGFRRVMKAVLERA